MLCCGKSREAIGNRKVFVTRRGKDNAEAAEDEEREKNVGRKARR